MDGAAIAIRSVVCYPDNDLSWMASTTMPGVSTMTEEKLHHNPAVTRLLGPGEEIRHAAMAGDAVLAVTTRRVAIVEGDRTALDLKIDGLRRIQFDIERSRPATLVVVPDEGRYPPQVLPVRPDQYEGVAKALVAIGLRLADSD
jgi:hypothetical protein